MNEKTAWSIFLKSGKVLDYINYLNCKKPKVLKTINNQNKEFDNACKNSRANN